MVIAIGVRCGCPTCTRIRENLGLERMGCTEELKMEKEKKQEEVKEAKEEKKDEMLGLSPEEFFKKIGFEKLEGKRIEEFIFTSAFKAVAEAIVPRLESVEIEYKHNRVRINFK